MHVRRWVASLLCALLGGALAIVPARAADTTPIEVPIIAPLTGPIAYYGSSVAKGLEMVASVANKQGGINGRPIKFVVYDDQSNAQVDNQLMSQIEAKGANIMMDTGSLASCLAASALVKADGPVLFCGTAAAHPTPGGFVYAVAPQTIDQFAAAMRYFRGRGLTKIAVLSTLDAVGQETDKEIDAVASLPENKSITLTNHEHMGITDLSATAQLERIRAAGAQAIIAGMSGTPFGTVLRGLRDGGLNLAIISSAANLSYRQNEGFANMMPSGELLVLGFPAYAPEVIANVPSINRVVQQLFAAMRENGIAKPEVGYVVAWDTGSLMIDALRKRGANATATQLRDYISSLRGFPGIFGPLDFKTYPQIGVGKDWIFVLRWDAAGDRFVGVSKPGGEPLATASRSR